MALVYLSKGCIDLVTAILTSILQGLRGLFYWEPIAEGFAQMSDQLTFQFGVDASGVIAKAK